MSDAYGRAGVCAPMRWWSKEGGPRNLSLNPGPRLEVQCGSPTVLERKNWPARSKADIGFLLLNEARRYRARQMSPDETQRCRKAEPGRGGRAASVEAKARNIDLNERIQRSPSESQRFNPRGKIPVSRAARPSAGTVPPCPFTAPLGFKFPVQPPSRAIQCPKDALTPPPDLARTHASPCAVSVDMPSLPESGDAIACSESKAILEQALEGRWGERGTDTLLVGGKRQSRSEIRSAASPSGF
ncbi:hypothetical protein B0H10DRAFT_2185057 [Mycena sp. CBHHK59/15]|nr:hypothetical protein B0H10DRAFT_2185057 [Mycena sp. CBHHK59/15]